MPRFAVRIPLVIVLAGLLAVGSTGPMAAQQGRPATPVAALPDAPFRDALGWILAVLNEGPASVTAADLDTHLAPAFREAVPIELITGLVQQVAADAPFVLEGFTRPPTAYQANALLVGRSGVPLVIPLLVEPSAPHRITGLNFTLVPSPLGAQPTITPLDAPRLAPGEVRRSSSGRVDGLVDIDGRQLYLSCAGEGSPTVVLESGLGDPAAPWYGIQDAIAGFTRVCSYDRPNATANASASDPAPQPRSAQDAVDDLHALLAAAEEPGPYVLVGHSFGGIIARLYASAYPDDVGGLVLVDSSHEEQQVRLEALVTPEQWAVYQALLAGSEFDLEASFDQMREARREAPLQQMPLAVITAGVEVDPTLVAAQLPPGLPVEEMGALHRELQVDLAQLVPNGRQIIARRSGHYVHQSEPDLVVDVIHQVVDAVRNPEAWASPVPATPGATPGATPAP